MPIKEIGRLFEERSMDHGFSLPFVEMNVEFDRSLNAGDAVTIELTPGLRERSVHFESVGWRDGVMHSWGELRV